MRAFQTGDIVRDCSLDEMLPTDRLSTYQYEVIEVSLSTEWSPVPTCFRIGDHLVAQQFLVLRMLGGGPDLLNLAAQEAFTHRGPRYEVVKPVEERVAETLMGDL